MPQQNKTSSSYLRLLWKLSDTTFTHIANYYRLIMPFANSTVDCELCRVGRCELAMRGAAAACRPTVVVYRTVAQHPHMRPPSSAAAEAGARRIMHRLSRGISLLSNPAALDAQLQAIANEQTPANQNPQIYRVSANSVAKGRGN